MPTGSIRSPSCGEPEVGPAGGGGGGTTSDTKVLSSAPVPRGTSARDAAAQVFHVKHGPRSDVEEADVLRVALDEAAAGLDVLSHQDGEELVGGRRVVECHL